MGYRLSKIYTRTGDNGETGLGDGSRTPKDSQRIEVIGDIDELNSMLGVLLAKVLPDAGRALLLNIQHRLFDLGGELCIPDQQVLIDAEVDYLEQRLDELNQGLPMLKEFILPGGSEAAALCHLARSICRRAERRLVTLARDNDVNPVACRYLNRLSDLLFVLARDLNRLDRQPDVLWQRD